MKSKTFIKNVLKVAFSNGISLLAGLAIGLIIPKLLGVRDYGFYKRYALYLSYVGLFHFGFIDGIYLKYGGKEYHDLDKPKFRTYTSFLLLLETIITVIIVLVAIFILKGDNKFIFLSLGVSLFITNITTYFKFISQITSRFNELSVMNILYSIFQIIIVGIIYLFSLNNYLEYISLLLIINLVIMIIYGYIYRDIIFGKRNKFKEEKSEIGLFFKIGLILLLSNIINIFIMNVNNQVVDIFYDETIFGIYSFSFTLLSIIATIISAISVVIYPLFKQLDSEKLKNNYSLANSLMLILIFVCITIYFPLCEFVKAYLGEYVDSLKIVRIIFPSIAITSTIMIIKHNYYKTFNLNKEYLILGIMAFVVMVGLNFGAFLVFGTLNAIAISTIIAFLLWYLFLEGFLSKRFNIKTLKELLYLVIMMSVFYGSSMIVNNYLGMAIYFVLIIVISLMFYFDRIKNFRQIREK